MAISLNNEKDVYDRAKANETGEVEIFDKIIFPEIIRRKELNAISDCLEVQNPKLVLDLGCGGGWLSKFLTSKGYNVVGIDLSKSLVINARAVCKESSFLIGNCLLLPFKTNSFDMIIGVGILHHLNINSSLKECARILRKGGCVLFMEPNALNPLMAIGRKLLPSEIHTDDEAALHISDIKEAMNYSNMQMSGVRYLFPYSFCVSYLLRMAESDPIISFSKLICPLIDFTEGIIENLYVINKFSGVIMVTGIKG